MHGLEKRFEAEAIKSGYTVLKKGWPDFLIIRGPSVNGVEVKSRHDRLKEHQIEMLRALDGACIKCYVYQETAPKTFATIPIEDALPKAMKSQYRQVDWRTNWDRGREHLLKGFDILKEIGISDDNILKHMRIMLSARSRDVLFRL